MRIPFLFILLCPAFSVAEPFSDYWYAGKAEVATYELKQSRYGQERLGHAVAVWVTEDFGTEKQVKLDNPAAHSASEKTKVMKINLIRRFTTGVYDYSLMRSTFMPIELKRYKHPLKTTLSSQDWCGQTFLQMNNKTDTFALQMNSYFESIGQVNKEIKKAFSEDQVWAQIRIAPNSLPVGELIAYPSFSYAVLEHKDIVPSKATARIIPSDGEMTYILQFKELGRNTAWTVESAPPYKLLRWEERSKSYRGKEVKNIGELKKLELTDYWRKNGKRFEEYRTLLSLPQFTLQK